MPSKIQKTVFYGILKIKYRDITQSWKGVFMMYSEYPVENANTLLRKVFGWMTLGLSLTGVAAWITNMIPGLQHAIAHNMLVLLLIIIAQFGVLMYLNFGLARMSKETAILSYVLYSLLTGLTLSVLFLVFTGASLALTFFICAAMFGAMALYGSMTKQDLSGLGTFLFMGLIGLIIAGLINMFVHSAQFNFIISIFGVIIFTLFTAYDVHMIKRMGMVMIDDGQESTKVSIICALRLYMDFLNLFLYLLNFFGEKKE